jgi:pimeloyl-ACP methyl ester carboxylesterase
MTSGPLRYFTPPNGPQLRLDDAGGTGLPVLFQHGLCGEAGQAQEVFPRDDAFRRVTLEMRGHGKSAAGDPKAFSIATFADDAAALIEARQFATLVVGGISMGAAIAMRMAVHHPQLVKGLIIARPAWAMDAAPGNMQPNAEAGELLHRFPGDQALAIFEQGDTAKRLADEAPDNLASLRSFFTREPLDITAALLRNISADGPGVSRSQLGSISVPTLIIGHRIDSVHPFSLAEELADLIPGAQLVEIAPKAQDRVRYVAEFRTAMHDFLKGFLL